MLPPTVIKVKVEPEIDLSGLNEEILDTLADKIAERLKARELNTERTIVINTPGYPQSPQYWPIGQVWC